MIKESLRLTPESIGKLTDLGTLKTFRKGEAIQQEDANIYSLPVVTSGSIRVSQSDDDHREMFLYYIHPGETCIMSFLGGLHRDKSKIKAVAEEDSDVLLLPIESMDKVLALVPEWMGYIFKVYYTRFEELLEIVNELTFKKMDDRLLSYLQKKKAAIGSYDLNITHEEIAQDLGTARVVVSRVLKKLEKEGLIELGRNRITLL
jgi:CRP/FNR family transcriptional regulator